MCSFNATFFNFPVICTGTHFFGATFSGALAGKFYEGTIKSGAITYVVIVVTPATSGPLSVILNPFVPSGTYILQLNSFVPTGTYILQLDECSSLGAFICAFPPLTVSVVNYNLLPYEPGISTSVVNDCPGVIFTAVLTGPGILIPTPFNYFELYNGAVLQQSSGPVPGNSYTFGIEPTPGTFHVKVFRPQPPGNPNAGQQSPCYYSIQHTHVVNAICILKAIDCGDPSITVVIDAPVLSGAIGQVIYAALGIYTERCWILEQTTDPVNAVLNGYTGPFADCPTCTPCSDITSTITGRDPTCGQSNGSITVTPTNGNAPYSFSWTGTTQTTQTITNLAAGTYTVTITDVNGCTGTNTIVLNNVPCNSYIITSCDGIIKPFVVQNPVTTPDPNPNNYVGNIFSGTITLPNGGILTGCFNMMPTGLPGVPDVSIVVTAYSFNTCLECNPLAYKISRCDDPNILYFTNTDLSAALNQVINNVTLEGCDDTTYPCDTLEEQCWLVEAAPNGLYSVTVTYNSLIYPDCDCCKPC